MTLDSSNGHVQSSNPFRLSFQRIPDECLLFIIGYISDFDIKTLHSFVLTNRFCFHATIPRLIRAGLSATKYDVFYPGILRTEKFFALIITSFLEARIKELDDKPNTAPRIRRALDRILEPFGLKLQFPLLLPGFEMLKLMLQAIHSKGIQPPAIILFRRSDEKINWARMDDAQQKGLTIDYSGFITDSPTVTNVRYPMIQLRSIPKRLQEKARRFKQEEKKEPTNRVGRLEETAQYQELLSKAFQELWLNYNYHKIHSYTLKLEDGEEIIHLSQQMAQLQRLHLEASQRMTMHQVFVATLFILTNQSKFPEKDPLDVIFHGNWRILGSSDVIVGPLRAARNLIYFAVGRPKELLISGSECFYQYSNLIDPSRLQRLEDNMGNRPRSEGTEIEGFLRRCKHIKDFDLQVGEIRPFSWIADEALLAAGLNTNNLSKPGKCSTTANPEPQDLEWFEGDTTDSPTMPLSNVKVVKLKSTFPYRFSLHTFNDAAIAFSSSLTHLRLSAQDYHPIMLEEDPELIRVSHSLLNNPRANGVGDWPFLLPNLQSIKVELNGVAYIKVGSFSQCPSLEELHIEFGEDYSINGMFDTQNSPWQQQEIEMTLFPIWNLPKLKKLELNKLAANLFDFRSLSNMNNLQSLRFFDWNQYLMSYSDYIELQSNIWKDRIAQWQGNDHNQHTPLGQNKPWVWSLPKLEYIRMEGLSTLMFSLDWLLACPNLDNICLELRNAPRKSRNRESDDDDDNELEWTSDDKIVIGRVPFFAKSVIGLNDTNEVINYNHKERIYNHSSQLKHIILQGRLHLSSEDLIRLLTTDTPRLETIHSESDWCSVFNTVKEADLINKAYFSYRMQEHCDYWGEIEDKGEATSSPEYMNSLAALLGLPGKHLKEVATNTNRWDANFSPRKHGLVKIKFGNVQRCGNLGVRVYRLNTNHYIDMEDLDNFNVSEDDSDSDSDSDRDRDSDSDSDSDSGSEKSGVSL